MSSETVSAFTEQELATIKGSSPEMQTKVADLLSQGLPPEQLIKSVRNVLESEKARDPIGSDAMVAGPTGMGLNNALELQHGEHENGRTTTNEKDVELLKVRVESRVKQMIASGASDKEIQDAVGQMAGTPELSAIAQQIAQQQLDAEKFNLFNTRDHGLNDGANFAAIGSAVAAVAGVAAYTAATEATAAGGPEGAHRYGLNTAPLPYVDMGPTTAALAFNPPPVPNVPDVRDPNRNLGNGIAS